MAALPDLTKDQQRALWELIERMPIMYQFHAGKFSPVPGDAVYRYLARAVQVAEEAKRD